MAGDDGLREAWHESNLTREEFVRAPRSLIDKVVTGCAAEPFPAGRSADASPGSATDHGRDALNETMTPHQGPGNIDSLVLRALTRKLVAKGVLSADEVRALLFDAAKRMNEVGSEQTDQAARSMVAEDLAPAFLGPW